MLKTRFKMGSNRGSATTEIMLTILVLAIVTAVAAPMHSSNLERERLAESDATLMFIKTQLSAYRSIHETYPVDIRGGLVMGAEWNDLESGMLSGKYFGDASYTYQSDKAGVTFVITCQNESGDGFTRSLDDGGVFLAN